MANIQDILFFIMQGFSGGVAGYITNKYAVNMIFKEYTPFKIGGAVKKNKEKFIKEVSELVERDIINSQTLIGSVKSEEFGKVIDSTCKDFIMSSLHEVFEGIKLKDIPKIKESSDYSITFIEQNLQEELPRFIDNISDKINIKDLLSDEQLSNISSFISNVITDTLDKNEQLENFISCLYNENKDLAISELLSKELTDDIIIKISEYINQYINDVIDDEQQGIESLQKIYELLDMKSIVDDIAQKLGEKTLVDVISEEGIDSISNILSIKLRQLLSQDENREKIKESICELIEIGKKIDVTLVEILPEDLADSLIDYIKNILPKVTPNLSNWIYENREKIDNMINAAAGETIEKMGEESLRGFEKFASMSSNASETFKVVDKAADMVNHYELSNKAGLKIYMAITDFIEETKVSDILNLLQDKFEMSSEEISEKILELISGKEEDLIKSFLNTYKERKVVEFFNVDLDSVAKSNLIPYLYKIIKNHKENINKYIDRFIKDKGEIILSKKISQLISVEDIERKSKTIPKILSRFIKEDKNRTQKIISNLVESFLVNIEFENLIKNNKEKIILVICSKFNVLKNKLLSDARNKEVTDLIDIIKDKEGFSLSLSEKLKNGIVNNIDRIFNNNIQKVIYNNLIKLDEDEICNIAQSFMGQQLKPLSYFGAFLGCLAGILSSFVINGNIDSLGFYNNYQTTLFSCILMGLVGVLTNVIALWMIFHPYEKNKFVAKIPVFKIFSQGYIPSHKQSFANGMAYFIDNELLKGKRVETLFYAREEKFSQSLVNYISKDEFRLLIDLAKENKSKFSKFSYEFLIEKAHNYKTNLAKLLISSINNKKLKDILSIKEDSKISSLVFSRIDLLGDKIVSFLQNKLDEDNKINEILPEGIIESINSEINKSIDDNLKITVEKYLKEEVIKSVVIQGSDFYKLQTSKTIGELVGTQNEENIKLWINNNIEDYVVDRLPGKISDLLKNYLKSQMDVDKTIGDVFDSKLKLTIDKNIPKLTTVLMEKIYDYIVENKEEVSNMLIMSIKSQLNFFKKMAYEFMNGDYILNLLIQNIIDTKLEAFIDESMYSSSKMISVSMNSAIYPSSVGDLGLDYNQINYSLLMNNISDNIKQNDDLSLCSNIKDLSIDLIDTIKEIQISHLIENTNIKSVDNIYELLSTEIVTVIDKLNSNYNNNTEEINNFINEFVREKITDKVLENNIKTLVNVKPEHLKYTSDMLIDKINNSEGIKEIVSNAMEDIYSTIKNAPINEILNEDILISDTQKLIDNLLKDVDFNQNNQDIIDKVVFNFIESEFKFMEADTKVYIIKHIVDAMLLSGISHTVDALEALKLKEITTEQVELMDPREIHLLFKSFAGDFFVKLYLYGFMGLVFGINIYLSIILGVVDNIYSKKIDKVEISAKNIFKE